MFNKKLLFLFLLVGVASCKTSGDVRTKGKDSNLPLDPSGVKTLEGPPSEVEGATVRREPVQQMSAEALERQLEVTRGELEELRVQIEKERQEWQLRNVENETERKKLQDALAQRSVPSASAPEPSSSDKNTATILWKQGIEFVQKKQDNEALVSLKSLLSNYPKSNHVWGANLVAGMIEYRLTNFKAAAIHFNQAIDMGAKRSVGPSLAWYFQGLAFLRMKKKEDASLFLGELDRRFPKTLVNTKAKKILAGKAKAPSDLFVDIPNWLDFVGP